MLDNKYKIGQKVWVCVQDAGLHMCHTCGHAHHEDGKYSPRRAEIIRMEKINTAKGCYIEYEAGGTSMIWSHRDLFFTKAEAQARCDELNKEASK